VIDLPCALCYETPRYLPEVTPLPALGAQPALTYGCVNRLEKVTDRMIALWGRILSAAPQSRLLVKDRVLDDALLRNRFLARLRAAGIDPARVALCGASPHAEHLKIFQRVDIGLDPFPQGGGVSSAEALFMGVPLVTLAGQTPPSRITASFLTLLGMRDWIARNEEDYLRIALEAGRDLASLAKLREGLRARAAASPWGDLPRYVRAVEDTYRAAWRRWCEGRSG
jgi:predicted O-linked N-acetylglucosamine transferase (SPINDLY family)